MLEAEARDVEAAVGNVRLKILRDEIRDLYLTLSLEGFFQTLEDFIDQSRKNLERVSDPVERERLGDQYENLVDFAMDLTLGLE